TGCMKFYVRNRSREMKIYVSRITPSNLHISKGQHFLRWSPISSATDAPRRIQETELETERFIKRDDSICGLVGENHRPLMPRQPLGSPDLIVPGEGFLGILCELHVIRRVGINEILRSQWRHFEIPFHELPVRENLPVRGEVAEIVDALVLAERDIELAAAVEPAEAVESGAVEVIKQPCC